MRTKDAILVVLGSLMTMDSARGHQCYVCASGITEDLYQLKKAFPLVTTFPACSAFRDRKRDKERFLQDCPKEQMAGCLTKFEAGGYVMRTCTRVKVDDCKEANGVTYCYCKGDSCNTPERKLAFSGSEKDVWTKRELNKLEGVPTMSPKEQSGSGQIENQALPGHSAPSFTRFSANYSDYEDNVDDLEGSGPEYTPFYYYDDEDGHNFAWYPKQNNDYRDVDTEYGDQESPDYSDTTDPPPHIMDEIPESPKLKNNRGEDLGDIVFNSEDVPHKYDEDTNRRPNSRGACHTLSHVNLLSLYLLHMAWIFKL